jgi:hypothetical protein
MPYISKTPTPPYYAVVFTSINAKVDHNTLRCTVGWYNELRLTLAT